MKKEIIKELRSHFETIKAEFQLGWDRKSLIPTFHAGEARYQPLTAPRMIKIPDIPLRKVLSAYHRSGDLDQWKMAVSIFRAPEMFEYLFVLLVCGFGSPLLHFIGSNSLLLHVYGNYGTGKRMLSNIINSIYGKCEDLILTEIDRDSDIIERCRVVGSLPITVQNWREWSTLAKWIEKGRTSKGNWKLIALAIDSNKKGLERSLAIRLSNKTQLSPLAQIGISHLIGNNYGLAGERYIQYLLDHYSDHQENLGKIINYLSSPGRLPLNSSSDHLILGAIAIYAAIIVNELSLIKIPIRAFNRWVFKTIALSASMDE